jgi:hypothetical protein
MQIPDSVVSGVISGDASGQRLDNVPSRFVYIKASAANVGNVTLGGADVEDGNGFVLDAGETTPMFTIDNLNRLYMYCASGDGISYIVFR